MMMMERHGARHMLLLLVLSAAAAWLTYIHAAHEFTLDGNVVELDDSNFYSAISSFRYVFLDFYAPWCGHCQKLSPELDAAASILFRIDEPIMVAKVDADRFKSLAAKYGVVGYPTLKLFMNGVPVDYNGPRKAESLVQAIRRLIAPNVYVLESDSSISGFVKAAGDDSPIFIGFGLSESIIASFAIKYKHKAWFSVAKDFSKEAMVAYDLEKVPALVSLYPISDERNIFYGPFEDNLLEEFIIRNQFPLIMPLSYDLLVSLRESDRKMVLMIIEDELDRNSFELINNLKSAASANRDLLFGYVGLKQWEEFASVFDIHDRSKLPRLVVWDGTERYWIVVGSEFLNKEDDQWCQMSRFMEGYRQGRTIQKKLKGPSLFRHILSIIFTARNVYIIVLMVATYTLIKNIYRRVKANNHSKKQTKMDSDASCSVSSECERQDRYQPADKED